MVKSLSKKHVEGVKYQAIAPAHCDGFEVTLECIPKEKVTLNRMVLENYMQDCANGITIKNVLYTTRNNHTFLWITLSPESSLIDIRTMTQLVNVLKAIQAQARLFWGCDDESIRGIYISKIDNAVDFKGSFIPDSQNTPYQEI